MVPRTLILILRLIHRLRLRRLASSRRPWARLLATVISFIRKIATHPQVAELLRFIFLGTIVETGRKLAQNIAEITTDSEFTMGDFAYDWVVAYLENHRVWNESRSFKVVARNPMSRPFQNSTLGKNDGHPHPIYEPATAQRPSLFRWRGYWMSIVSSLSAGRYRSDYVKTPRRVRAPQASATMTRRDNRGYRRKERCY
ncbi:hypothetical protein C8J57DRAFT_1061163 [Mycena rebaudengoi]|nr:hypothetical protein C8J57DRAFT_1061163 [Mycena rebaudengoi]